MVALRGALPLLLAGSTGLALVAVGIAGLAGVDPDLARAADVARQERTHRPVVPDVPAAPSVRRLVEGPGPLARPTPGKA